MAYALLGAFGGPTGIARALVRTDRSLEALRPRLSTGLPFVASPL